MTDTGSEREAGRNDEARDDRVARAWIAVLVAAAALHASLLRYFTPSGLVFSGKPIHEYDYALHVYQVDRAVRAFESAGHFWSYDPFVLAGQPAGVVEDVTSKSLEFFVVAAHGLGLNPWMAFNGYVFAIHFAMPFIGFIAARLFGLSRLASAITVLFWIVLWYFDSFLHWCWYVGMVSWGASSCLIVLIVALMYRALRDGRTSFYVALGATAAVVTLVHPFAPVTLVLPLGALYARSFSRLEWREHAMLLGGTLAAAATTLTWIGPAIRFRHDIGQVDAFLWPTAPYVFLDWMDLLKDVLMTGQPVRTVFRVLALALAAVGVARWRRDHDDRALPLGVLVFGSFALAYGSGYSAILRQTQPYRNIGPATLAAALVAAVVVTHAAETVRLRDLSRNAQVALGVVAVLVVPSLARTALQFLPTWVPSREPSRTARRPGAIPGESNDELAPIVMGHEGPRPEYAEIASLLEQSFGQSGRVVVLDWVLGEYLATFTQVPILGGIPQRNVPQVDAHPLRHSFVPRGPGDDPLGRYFDEYAVSGVVASGPLGQIDARSDLLVPLAAIGDLRVYRARRTPTYFAKGSGFVGHQALNRVSVTGATPGEVVLKFHYLESLRCRPDCDVTRSASADDSAGFIRVPSAPPAFEIFNAYD
jgi:hypothetical protein